MRRRQWLKKVFLTWPLLGSLLLGVAGRNVMPAKGAPRGNEKIAVFKDTINIGFAAPTTGKLAEYGQDMERAVELAVEEGNRAGGAGGKRLALIAHDDKADPKEAVTVATRLVTEPGLAAAIAHLNSDCTRAAGTYYKDAGIVQITAGSTNPELSRRGFKTFFRICPTDDVQAPAALTYARKKLGKKRIVVLHVKDTYGQGIATELKKAATKQKATFLAVESVSKDDTDFSPVLTKIKPLNPDLILYVGYNEGGLVLKQARRLGIKAAFMGTDGMFDEKFIEHAQVAAEGVYCTFVAPGSPREFIERYRKKYRKEPRSYAPLTYDAARIVIAAIQRAAKRPEAKRESGGTLRIPRAVILEEVRKTKNFKGVSGTISFDRNGDLTNKTFFVYQVKNGKWVYVGPAT